MSEKIFSSPTFKIPPLLRLSLQHLHYLSPHRSIQEKKKKFIEDTNLQPRHHAEHFETTSTPPSQKTPSNPIQSNPSFFTTKTDCLPTNTQYTKRGVIYYFYFMGTHEPPKPPPSFYLPINLFIHLAFLTLKLTLPGHSRLPMIMNTEVAFFLLLPRFRENECHGGKREREGERENSASGI